MTKNMIITGSNNTQVGGNVHNHIHIVQLTTTKAAKTFAKALLSDQKKSNTEKVTYIKDSEFPESLLVEFKKSRSLVRSHALDEGLFFKKTA